MHLADRTQSLKAMPLASLELLLAEHACRRVVLQTAKTVDEQDYTAFANLFTPQGLLVRPDGTRLEGRATIEAAYRQRGPDRLTRHLISNHLVTVQDASNASSSCAVLLWTGSYRDAAGPKGRPADATQLVGEFLDELVMTDEGWRIQQRQARFTLHLEG